MRLSLEPGVLDSYQRPDGAAAPAFVFSLSYIFTSGSNMVTSKESHFRAPASQLRFAPPGGAHELGWNANSLPRPPSFNSSSPANHGSTGRRLLIYPSHLPLRGS